MAAPDKRARWNTRPDEIAECRDCGYFDGGAGAMGRAARHHDATGHVVRVEQSFIHVYGEDQPGKRRWWKEHTR